jgi:hypothetical protein
MEKQKEYKTIATVPTNNLCNRNMISKLITIMKDKHTQSKLGKQREQQNKIK